MLRAADTLIMSLWVIVIFVSLVVLTALAASSRALRRLGVPGFGGAPRMAPTPRPATARTEQPPAADHPDFWPIWGYKSGPPGP